MIWQVLHHLVGLRRLGFDVWYVEDLNGPILTPDTWQYISDPNADYSRSIEFVAQNMDRVGLGDRWIFRPSKTSDICFGSCDVVGLSKLYSEADAIFNLCGENTLLPEHKGLNCLVYLQTDPVAQQIAVAEGNSWMIEELDSYDHLFTYGENLGAPDCFVPVERYVWHPTRPPVCVDWWCTTQPPTYGKFTTIAHWRNRGKDVDWHGETYFWQKASEFQKFINLPFVSPYPIELALIGIKNKEQDEMREHGWSIKSARDLSDPEKYRDYIRCSVGEFSVAKDQNIRMRSGWFSDRSACYLAAGRPVIMQDTGFGNILPTGEGLFSFSNEDEALGALDSVAGDYAKHSNAAREIAHEFFRAERVLKNILNQISIL